MVFILLSLIVSDLNMCSHLTVQPSLKGEKLWLE